jgi:hypothetical protein
MEEIKFTPKIGEIENDLSGFRGVYAKQSSIKILGFVILSIIFALIPLIIIYWSKKCYIALIYKRTAYSNATHLLIIHVYYSTGYSFIDMPPPTCRN